jgi:hypothetical protein
MKGPGHATPARAQSLGEQQKAAPAYHRPGSLLYPGIQFRNESFPESCTEESAIIKEIDAATDVTKAMATTFHLKRKS